MKNDLSIKAAIYLRAAELIDGGHCKNFAFQVKDGKTSYCMVGALHTAREEYGEFCIPDYDILTKHVGGNVPNWNNAPERTGAEVAAKLRDFAFR